MLNNFETKTIRKSILASIPRLNWNRFWCLYLGVDCQEIRLWFGYLSRPGLRPGWPRLLLWCGRDLVRPEFRPVEVQGALRFESSHCDVFKWKRFPCYWPFLRGIHRSPVNSLHKGQWRGALMVISSAPSLNGWINNHEAGDLRRHCVHYNIIVIGVREMSKNGTWQMSHV